MLNDDLQNIVVLQLCSIGFIHIQMNLQRVPGAAADKYVFKDKRPLSRSFQADRLSVFQTVGLCLTL